MRAKICLAYGIVKARRKNATFEEPPLAAVEARARWGRGLLQRENAGVEKSAPRGVRAPLGNVFPAH